MREKKGQARPFGPDGNARPCVKLLVFRAIFLPRLPPRVADLALRGIGFAFGHFHCHSPVTTMVTGWMSADLRIENAEALMKICPLTIGIFAAS